MKSKEKSNIKSTEQSNIKSKEQSNIKSNETSKIKSQEKDSHIMKTTKDGFHTNWDGIVDSFEEMGLSKDILRGIYSYGWEKPSKIQQRAIIPVIKGHDTIAQAQSGTGKTGTFSIATLEKININKNICQILILSPVRELARQTHKVICSLGIYMKGLKCHMCIGGTSVRDDIKAIEGGVHIIVGTPGRVNSMINKNVLKLNNLQLFILDEADEMLSRGFKEQIYECFQYLPNDVQVALYSATMPMDVLEITSKFMRNPIRILVKKEELTLDGIKQYYVAVEKEDYKLGTLFDLYENLNIIQAIIFVNTRRKSQWLCDKMTQNDFTVSCIHGEQTPNERGIVMREFRSGTSRVLISTDLLARGIDVNTVSLVINYDLPKDKENYIHRIGRGGRYGKKGCAINFVPDDEADQLRELEKFYDTIIDELPAKLDDI
eukprot:240309_1